MGNIICWTEFKKGQKVILHYRPVEFQCPHCKHTYGSKNPAKDYTCRILNVVSKGFCTECQGEIDLSEGWYSIVGDGLPTEPRLWNNQEGIAPYTLLEAIDAT